MRTELCFLRSGGPRAAPGNSDGAPKRPLDSFSRGSRGPRPGVVLRTGRFRVARIDRPFIVLTETKTSHRHIPVWARYSPLWTRVEAHANTL